MEIGAIILSGGKSSRFGSDKGLVDFKGKALIEYAIKASCSFTKDIIISTNNNAYNRFGLPIIKDLYQNTGPLGGIYSALQASSHDLNLVLPCDTPYINKALIKILIDHYNHEEVLIFKTEDGKYHPLLGLYHKNLLPKMKKSLDQNHFKLIQFIFNRKHTVIPLNKDHSFQESFLNFNHREELNKHE